MKVSTRPSSTSTSTNTVRSFASCVSVLTVLCLVVPQPSWAVHAEGGPVLDLDVLVAEALEGQPAVQSAAAMYDAAGERISQVGSLPDPMVSVGYQNDGWDRFTFGDRPMSNLAFTVSQMFPFPGKRGLRRTVAAEMQGGARAMTRMARVNAVKTVRERYMDLVRTGEVLKVLDMVLEQVKRVEEIATARYGSGVAGMQDVLMAQSQKYRVLETIRTVEDERRQAAARLWEAVGRRPSEEAGSAPPVSLVLPGGTVDLLITLALEESPAVEKAQRELTAAETALALAKRDVYPDITVSGMYAARNSSAIHDLWRVGIGTTIPLFYRDKQAAAIREAEHKRYGAEQELERARQGVDAAVRSEWSGLERSEELMALYEGGLKQKSLEGLEASLTAYRNGNADMTMVLKNLVDSMNAEMGYWKHFSMRQIAVARLSALAGLEGGGGIDSDE